MCRAFSPTALVALLMLIATARSQNNSDSVSNLAALPHRRVCTSTYTSMDECGPTNNSVQGYTGYELELFKRVAEELASQDHLEWAPGNWSFVCLTHTPTAVEWFELCDVVVSAVTPQELQSVGIPLSLVRFSYTTYASGRRIVIHRGNSTTIWTFLQPFSNNTWLLMFGCTVLVALVVAWLESPWAQPGGSGTQGSGMSDPLLTWLWNKYSNVQWSVVGLMLRSIHQLAPSTPGGRVVVLGTTFTALLLACMYTSSYTALITVNNLKAEVSSMDDLIGLPVGIAEGDQKLLSSFELENVHLFPWMTQSDEEEMIRQLRSGEVAALVIDAPFADYYTSSNCDLFEVGEMVMPMNQGFVFNASVSEAYVLHFDHVLLSLWNEGFMAELADKYIRIKTTCPFQRVDMIAETQIQLHDVGGLWVFVAACVGVGVLWHLLTWLVVQLSTRFTQQSLPVSGVRHSKDSKLPTPLEDAVTVDEHIQAVQTRMDRIARQLRGLPTAFAASLDTQLADLSTEVATVLTKSMQLKEAKTRGAEPPSDNSGNAPGTPADGTLEEHLAHITSKFNKMQDQQQR